MGAYKVVLFLAASCVLAAAQPPKTNTAMRNFAAHTKPGTMGVVLPGKAVGVERKLGGLDTYVAITAGNKAPKAAVILFTDIFGWKFPNTRLWADRLAASTGYVVVVPDYFKGDAWRDGRGPMDKLFAWIGQFKPPAVLAQTDSVIADVKKAYPSVKKIGTEGFCWGGLYTTLMAGNRTNTADAGVAFHASLVQSADVEAIRKPHSYQNADPKLDTQIKTEQYAAFKKILDAKKAKGLDTPITYYPGQAHGFSLRGNRTDPATAKAMHDAFNAGVAFLKKYLN